MHRGISPPYDPHIYVNHKIQASPPSTGTHLCAPSLPWWAIWVHVCFEQEYLVAQLHNVHSTRHQNRSVFKAIPQKLGFCGTLLRKSARFLWLHNQAHRNTCIHIWFSIQELPEPELDLSSGSGWGNPQTELKFRFSIQPKVWKNQTELNFPITMNTISPQHKLILVLPWVCYISLWTSFPCWQLFHPIQPTLPHQNHCFNMVVLTFAVTVPDH
jgi:hypothetical protein